MVPSIAELTVFYGLLVPVRSLKDNPTTKAEAEQYGYAADGEEDPDEARIHVNVLDQLASLVEVNHPEVGRIELGDLAGILLSFLRTDDVDIAEFRRRAIEKCGELFPNQRDAPFLALIHALMVDNSAQKLLIEPAKRLKRSHGFSSMTYGFLGYPVSQAADITFVGAHLVPVGPDQVPLIELCREVVHRVNAQYGSDGGTAAPGRHPQASATGGRPTEALPLLVEPQALLGSTELIRGLDGSVKMGKSLGNAVYLSDDSDTVWRQLRGAVTDPQRVRRDDPGRPEICNIFAWHKVFNGEREPATIKEDALGVPSVEWTAHLCRTAGIGCVDCKKNLHKKLDALLDPMRQRRAYWEQRPDEVIDILRWGTRRASEEGEKTLAGLKSAMHIDHFDL
jgi:tryptophanyl-tRNA synthetase